MERFNQTLGNALKKTADGDLENWDKKIPFILFAYRTSMQASAKNSPFFLAYAREPRLPIDIAFEDPEESNVYDVEDYRKLLVERAQEGREIARDSIMKEQIKMIALTKENLMFLKEK